MATVSSVPVTVAVVVSSNWAVSATVTVSVT